MTMEQRTLGFDPLTGVYETFYFDHATDEITIEQTQNVDAHVELTKASFNESGTDWKGDFHHVASIPAVMLSELAKKGIMTTGGRILDKKKLRAWLNSSDNRAFRTRPGHI